MTVTGKLTYLAIALALVAGGCAWAGAGDKRPPDKRLIMDLRLVPPLTCIVIVKGEQYSLPAHQDRMVLALRELRSQWKSARAVGDVDMPYRCLSHAVYLAQMAGFREVDYVNNRPSLAGDGG